uniref:Eukaryotic translation initiation factor 2 subunit beta n=1 Tax=Rhizophora mucronata TaxID=61149 RepID=A0A2P2L7V7_RHIMU
MGKNIECRDSQTMLLTWTFCVPETACDIHTHNIYMLMGIQALPCLTDGNSCNENLEPNCDILEINCSFNDKSSFVRL